MRWPGNVALMGRIGMNTGFRWENQKERDHSHDLDVGARIIVGGGGMCCVDLPLDRERRASHFL
jgi:hypothetical protein